MEPDEEFHGASRRAARGSNRGGSPVSRLDRRRGAGLRGVGTADASSEARGNFRRSVGRGRGMTLPAWMTQPTDPPPGGDVRVTPPSSRRVDDGGAGTGQGLVAGPGTVARAAPRGGALAHSIHLPRDDPFAPGPGERTVCPQGQGGVGSPGRGPGGGGTRRVAPGEPVVPRDDGDDGGMVTVASIPVSILRQLIWGSDLRRERESRLAAAGCEKMSPAPLGPEPKYHRLRGELSWKTRAVPEGSRGGSSRGGGGGDGGGGAGSSERTLQSPGGVSAAGYGHVGGVLAWGSMQRGDGNEGGAADADSDEGEESEEAEAEAEVEGEAWSGKPVARFAAADGRDVKSGFGGWTADDFTRSHRFVEPQATRKKTRGQMGSIPLASKLLAEAGMPVEPQAEFHPEFRPKHLRQRDLRRGRDMLLKVCRQRLHSAVVALEEANAWVQIHRPRGKKNKKKKGSNA